MKWLVKIVAIRGVFGMLIVFISRIFNIVGIPLRALFSPIRSTWTCISKFKRHFILNFMIGIVIAIILHLMHHTSIVSEFENIAIDSMMVLNQGTERMMSNSDKNEAPLAFTLIDIDENTYRHWDEPAQIPRDKLLKLITFAAKNNAKAIVVDIDLSRPSGKDKALLDYLEKYDKDYPPLLLIRDIYPRSKFTEHKNYIVRPSILDNASIGEMVFYAQPIFKISVYDQKVRYWQLLKKGCLNNEVIVIPSFQLLVDAYLNSNDGLQNLNDQLIELTSGDCGAIDDAHHKEFDTALTYGDKKIEVTNSTHQRIGERIIYTLPWSGTSSATNELLIKPAHRLTETSKEPSPSSVEGRVVVIGASFQDSRDYHQTPLGEMPGAMIIVNAIKSLHLFGQTKPPSTMVKLILELLLIVVMSWAFARYNSIIGTIATSIFIVIILLPISFYFFKYGLWIDLAVPLLGMQLHNMVAKLEENIAIRKRLKNSN